MSDSVVFARKWNTRLREPRRIMSESEALQFFVRGETFTTVLVRDETPWAMLEISMSVPRVDVVYLDEHRWEAEGRVFVVRPGSDDLWLEQIHRYTVDAEGERTAIESMWFWPEGRSRAERNFKGNATKEVAEGRFDPADRPWLWEPVPTFGNYASILRADRTKSV